MTFSCCTSSAQPSRSSSKKIHNFGKRSNSIKRNLNAQVVKSSWLHKQVGNPKPPMTTPEPPKTTLGPVRTTVGPVRTTLGSP